MAHLNYMQLSSEIFEKLRAIRWFSMCEEPPDENFPIDVIWISDWPTASKHLSDPEWENTTLEAQNALTNHLAKEYSREYLEWNKLVREAKTKLAESAFQAAEQFQQK